MAASTTRVGDGGRPNMPAKHPPSSPVGRQPPPAGLPVPRRLSGSFCSAPGARRAFLARSCVERRSRQLLHPAAAAGGGDAQGLGGIGRRMLALSIVAATLREPQWIFWRGVGG